MRTLTRLLVSLVVLVVAPGVVRAQSVMGGMAGATESRQLRDRREDSATRTGAMAGAFLDVDGPVAHLDFLVEVFFAQRGGRLPLGSDPDVLGEVEHDVLGFTVAPELGVGVGPLYAYGYAGPMLEVPVRTRYTDELSLAYRNPAGQVLAVTAGAGLRARFGVWSVGVEARVVEELSAAFSGDVGDFRHRAKEIVVRVGRSVVR